MIYLVVPFGSKFRLIKREAKRATRVLNSPSEAKSVLPGKAKGTTLLVVQLANDGRPRAWDVG